MAFPPWLGRHVALRAASSTRRRVRGATHALVWSFALLLSSGPVAAQSWSATRARPALHQIIAIDRTGELSWPYGLEDVAGDGLAAQLEDEASVDLRTVYADATAERLFVRAYVVSARAPTERLTAFFFFDSDGDARTGGKASGEPFLPRLASDPSDGGYERALAVRGDGMALNAWGFDETTRNWNALSLAPDALRGEAGTARDPLQLGVFDHGYVQASALHALTGLNATCGGRIFVRLRHEEGMRSLSDETRDEVACRAPLDAYGDPNVVRAFRCTNDAQCPNGGRCRDDVCLWAYDCSADVDCRGGERCNQGRCVGVVDAGCTSDAACDGLVCEAGRCVACAEGGPESCAGGSACSPNGRCVDTDDFVPTGSDRVQGGAFHCAAEPTAAGAIALLPAGLALLLLRRRRIAQRRGGPRC
jgi:hypothetical protein